MRLGWLLLFQVRACLVCVRGHQQWEAVYSHMRGGPALSRGLRLPPGGADRRPEQRARPAQPIPREHHEIFDQIW